MLIRWCAVEQRGFRGGVAGEGVLPWMILGLVALIYPGGDKK